MSRVRLARLLRTAATRAAAAAGLQVSARDISTGRWIFHLSSAADPPGGDRREPRGFAEPRVATLVDHLAHAPAASEPQGLLCPSASFPDPDDCPDPDDSHIFGIVAGTTGTPEVVFLATPVAMSEALYDLTEPFAPSELFRIAAPCLGHRCKNFGGGICYLGRALAGKPAGNSGLPACAIRAHCRWWRQEGPTACASCTGVVTDTPITLKVRKRLSSQEGATDGE
jgi:hypothetical protein